MLQQYLVTTLRTFRRNKVITLINTTGLVIGLCAALVIFLIVRYDFSFDKHHKDGDRIYRVVTDMTFASEPFPNSGVPGTLPDAVRSDVTGVEEVAPFFEANVQTATIPTAPAASQHFKKLEHVVFADGHFFNLFSYHWLAGNPASSLKEPYQVALTENRARAYFPGIDLQQIPGHMIIYDDSVKAIVTGIIAEPDHISDLHYKEFISYTTLTNTPLKNTWPDAWGSVTSNQQCCIRLAKGITQASVEKQLAGFIKKYTKEDPKTNNKTVYSLQPLSDVHFNGKYQSMGPRTASKPALYGLAAAGIFLLLLACINYINLTTAQASQRAKEIGVRKTMGASRRQLTFQFLGETFFLTLAATLIGAFLTPILLKTFSDFIPDGVRFSPLSETGIILFLVALVVTVSFLAGFYPALVLAAQRPVQVMKNQAFAGASGTRRAWLRKTLTVFQFVIAQVFVLGTLLVGKQISYAINKDLGYRKDAIITTDAPYNFYGPADMRKIPLLNAIAALPGVQMVALGQEPPASSGYSSTTMKYREGPQEINTDVQLKDGDTNYIKIYNLRLLAGHNIRNCDSTREYIINETYAHILGFQHAQDAVGHHIERGKDNLIPIVGVVEDFHQASLRTAIKPIAISSNLRNDYGIHVLLRPENADGTAWKKTIDGMKAAFTKLYPGEEFEYSFFDEAIAKFYKTEQNTARLLTWATGLSILISCLGLLGLVLFTTRARTKEIGVRKVLGASAMRIVTLLSGDFIRLVGLAFIIAAPLAYWGMHIWLENFADRTSVSWWLFVLGGVIMLVTATLTLSIQTIRAARANPVESLRSE